MDCVMTNRTKYALQVDGDQLLVILTKEQCDAIRREASGDWDDIGRGILADMRAIQDAHLAAHPGGDVDFAEVGFGVKACMKADKE